MAQSLTQADIADGLADPQALSALSGGSVGDATTLIEQDGLKLYADIIDLLATLPNLDRSKAIALAESAAGRGKEARLDLVMTLLDRALSRLARMGASGSPPTLAAAPHEAETFARLCPTPEAARTWAQLAQHEGDRLRHGRAVNVDPASLLLASFLALQDGCPR